MTGNAQQRPSQGGKVRDKSHEESHSTRTPERETSPSPSTRRRPDSDERRNAETESPPDD